ncbi:tRNA a64-2'-O-ribosylphosphate transferase [Eremomyces bilateralis CBS 781.70]|uniref:tRNA a64-2'-O-ribosylphosphate transferase n=1 Tax=Eremomyces bilateralis CBS 781.70 TaxID=1392243 RepID=A0A6G1G234_9PEZI|nr:tRNA a64-2'-O-ribosylphosphate transferase [Eremomyces bilateralis CBS 781.70]KAF1812078.1 tRNA a64-2'-O-ribosylphosphate transferase [Eremomyces bilateralis CBS 781.70]
MSQPLQHTDLIFPELATDFNKTLGSLKSHTLSIPNRLRSILTDASFVTSVAHAYHLPLVANERCGSWYIPPSLKSASAYFKSTDGHFAQWSFSLRRLNLPLLGLLPHHGGAIIVDSTRRGKKIPDALSKTVPIWCAVWNRLLRPDDPECHALATPPSAVSRSEHAQIAARLDQFIAQAKVLDLDLEPLRQELKKPLRPLWVTTDSILPDSSPQFDEFYPIVCCTSSRAVGGAEMSEGGYIQGAGDDAEGWSRGLTAPVFWANKEALLGAPEGDLPEIIEGLMAREEGERRGGEKGEAALVKPTRGLYLGRVGAVDGGPFGVVVQCGAEADEVVQKRLGKRYLYLNPGEKKVGGRYLRHLLPRVKFFIEGLEKDDEAKETGKAVDDDVKVLICDDEGKDIAVGVALVVCCLFYSDDGTFSTQARTTRIDKDFIRRRLGWIVSSSSTANPSRATLRSVNEFLMSQRYGG